MHHAAFGADPFLYLQSAQGRRKGYYIFGLDF
jgi:hypothetical protein